MRIKGSDEDEVNTLRQTRLMWIVNVSLRDTPTLQYICVFHHSKQYKIVTHYSCSLGTVRVRLCMSCRATKEFLLKQPKIPGTEQVNKKPLTNQSPLELVQSHITITKQNYESLGHHSWGFFFLQSTSTYNAPKHME